LKALGSQQKNNRGKGKAEGNRKPEEGPSSLNNNEGGVNNIAKLTLNDASEWVKGLGKTAPP